MLVEFHPKIKIDSRDVVLGDWYFYSDDETIRKILSPEELEQVKWDLDTHNARIDPYGLFPKVFTSPFIAREYQRKHLSEFEEVRRHAKQRGRRGPVPAAQR